MIDIKIVPYEDREKLKSFNPCFANWNDDKIKTHVIKIAAIENEKYENTRRLIEVLDNFNLDDFRNNKTVLIFGDMYFVSWTV